MSLSPEILSVIDRVQKLMRLADNNPSAEEAAAATTKAQALLEAHNLEISTVEKAQGKSAVRERGTQNGGLYQFQRDLWRAVAELNFCMYRSHKGLVKGSKYHHEIIGRSINVASTNMMARYLEEAIERLVRDFIDDKTQLFARRAFSFREGAAADITRRLWDRREQKLREERAKQAANDARAAHQSSSTAMTLAVFVDAETDANNDFIHGEGYSAKCAAARAKYEAAGRVNKEKKAQWERDNPEEAARVKAQAEKENAEYWAKWEKRQANRKPRAEKPRDYSAYWAGERAASEVSIDLQVDETKKIK